MCLHVLELTLLFYLCVLVQNVAAQECRAKNSINFNRKHFNVRLNGYVIQNITVPAAADCARECFRLTKCLSFNMATSIGLCQLNSVNSSTNLTSNFVADHKFNYFDLSVFPETIAGPCGKKPCLVHQMCLPTGGKHTCANVAEPGWSIDPDTGWVTMRGLSTSKYLLATDAGTMRFNAASKYCVKIGGHLLYLETDAEITMVTDYLMNGTAGKGNSFWLGMTDRESEGDWWWGTHSRVSRFKWMEGEPVGGSWDCAILDAVNSYQWRNVLGTQTRHYALCEKD